MAPSEAREWLDQHTPARAGSPPLAGSSFDQRLRTLIARFWADRPVEADYLGLKSAAATRVEEARVELIYGQLLVSRFLRAGLEHLERGFQLAVEDLPPRDYLELRRRHQALRLLPLGQERREAQSLRALLAQAAVIERLERNSPRETRAVYPPPHREDTVG